MLVRAIRSTSHCTRSQSDPRNRMQTHAHVHGHVRGNTACMAPRSGKRDRTSTTSTLSCQTDCASDRTDRTAGSVHRRIVRPAERFGHIVIVQYTIYTTLYYTFAQSHCDISDRTHPNMYIFICLHCNKFTYTFAHAPTHHDARASTFMCQQPSVERSSAAIASRLSLVASRRESACIYMNTANLFIARDVRRVPTVELNGIVSIKSALLGVCLCVCVCVSSSTISPPFSLTSFVFHRQRRRFRVNSSGVD